MRRFTKSTRLGLLFVILLGAGPSLTSFSAPVAQATYSITQDATTITIGEDNYKIVITKAGFKYAFKRVDNTTIAGSHATSGLCFSAPDSTTLYDAATTSLVGYDSNRVQFLVTNTNGNQADVFIYPRSDYNKFQVYPKTAGKYIIDARTAEVGKGYGLGDFGRDKSFNGYTNNDFTNNSSGNVRFITNFVIYPAQGLAQVLFEENQKRVAITNSESRLGAANVTQVDRLYYFIGTLPQIYARYQTVKASNGFQDYKPKAAMFGLGWEAYGALNSGVNWNTRQQPVEDSISRYFQEGYELSWGVVGSRYWRGNPSPKSAGTTRFGMWDDGSPGSNTPPNYPDPQGLKDFFHSKGMKLILGLRISMESTNPFYQEAQYNGYFVSGHPGIVDLKNPAALDWYINGVNLWGVDGFKEDLCCDSTGFKYDDDKVNNGDERLMAQGSYVIVRNSAYAIPGDISRREDTQYNGYYGTPREISSIAIAYAASGAPNYYPDIVMGTNQVDSGLNADEERYFVRNTTVDAAMPSMAFGYGPWNISNTNYRDAVKEAADWHTKFMPYIYSAAQDSYNSGFPYTLTPLPLAYPNEPSVYDTPEVQWMLGPSIMTTGACFTTINPVPTDCSANLTIPPGKWIDFNSGDIYNGPTTINYALPIGKMALFVGGKGTVVFRNLNDNKFYGRVYQIATGGSSYKYTDTDGTTTSTITNDNTGWNNATLVITDTTSNISITATYDAAKHCYTFPLTFGHNYQLSGGN